MLYLARYYPLILGGLSLAMALAGALVVLGRTRNGLRGLAEGFRSLGRKRRIWPFVMTVLTLNCFLFPWRVRFHTAGGITLNYSLASQGLNPNGTRFNQTDILCREVLERAIEKGALKGLTPEDLKEALRVRPSVQGNVDSEGSYFISTQFTLTYTATEATAHLNGEQVLTLVLQSYREWFVGRYSENTAAFQLDFTQAERQDYLDMCSFFKTAAAGMENYLNPLAAYAASFQSERNGETFQSMAAKARAVSNVMVESLEAYVLEEHVSKSRPDYMNRLSFENVFLTFDAEKAEAASRNNLSAISMYENDMARIVLVPTYDTNDQFYMSQTRIGVDEFAKTSDALSSQATAIHSEIAYNNHVISMFSQGTGEGGTDPKAEDLVRQIEGELTQVARLSRELVEEYSLQQANQYMSWYVSTAESQARSLLVQIVLYTLLFALALRFFVNTLKVKTSKAPPPSLCQGD